MDSRWKFYEYKGEKYTLKQLCEIFEVSKQQVYYKVRFYKMDIFDAIRDLDPFHYDLEIRKIKREEIQLSSETNEEFIEMIIGNNPHVCSQFGCGKHLSITEKLCGTKCLEHQ